MPSGYRLLLLPLRLHHISHSGRCSLPLQPHLSDKMNCCLPLSLRPLRHQALLRLQVLRCSCRCSNLLRSAQDAPTSRRMCNCRRRCCCMNYSSCLLRFSLPLRSMPQVLLLSRLCHIPLRSALCFHCVLRWRHISLFPPGR